MTVSRILADGLTGQLPENGSEDEADAPTFVLS